MKLHHLLILTCCLDHALAQDAGKSLTAMRDVVTHDQLVQGLKSAQQLDPMKKMTAATGEDPSVKGQPEDLLSQSDIICFNGLATLVPKRAILASPADLQDRLAVTEDAKFVGWSEFLVANRGWISTEEVSFEQATGKLPLPDAATQRIVKSTNLIVATYMGGPISVMAPPTPPTP